MTMPEPLLSRLFIDLQDQLAARLRSGRHLGHRPSQGAVSEDGWLDLLANFLPNRYCVRSAFVVDSRGDRSDQIDLLIHDPQYTPLLFKSGNETYVPAESVYAVFEVKQAWSARDFEYAADKAASVRRLHRTSAAIPHAGGVFDPKPPKEILAGILASRSSWHPTFGDSLEAALAKAEGDRHLDLGCAVESGAFSVRPRGDGTTELVTAGPDKALVSFFLSLLEHLQRLATVTAIDYRVYQTAALGG
jgi:hypothetical protein